MSFAAASPKDVFQYAYRRLYLTLSQSKAVRNIAIIPVAKVIFIEGVMLKLFIGEGGLYFKYLPVMVSVSPFWNFYP